MFDRSSRYTLAQIALAGEDVCISRAQPADTFARELMTLQANQIEAEQAGAIADNKTIGNDVAFDRAGTADKCIAPHAGELMDGCTAAENNVIADLAMACQQCGTGDDNAIAQNAVMADMDAGQCYAFVTDLGEMRPLPVRRRKSAQ